MAQGVELVAKFIAVEEAVDEPEAKGVPGGGDGEPVGVALEAVGVQFPGLGDLLAQVVPGGVGDGGELPAVFVAQPVEDEGFAGAFEAAVADEVDADAEFVEEAFVKQDVGGESFPGEAALGVEVDFVADGGEVVAALGVEVGVGDDEFAALAEGGQGLPEFVEGGEGGGKGHGHLEVDAVDAGVLGGEFDPAHGVEQGGLVPEAEGAVVEQGEGVVDGFVDDGAGEVDVQDAMGLQVALPFLAARAGGAEHAEQSGEYEEAEQKKEDAAHEDGEQAGKKGLEKGVHGYFCDF